MVPEWLHDIFLGYGDPAAAQYSSPTMGPASVAPRLQGGCRPGYRPLSSSNAHAADNVRHAHVLAACTP